MAHKLQQNRSREAQRVAVTAGEVVLRVGTSEGAFSDDEEVRAASGGAYEAQPGERVELVLESGETLYASEKVDVEKLEPRSAPSGTVRGEAVLDVA